MKYDYFISARWRNRPQVEELVNKLRKKDKRVYSFIEANSDHPGRDRDPDLVMKDFEAISDWINDPVVKTIYERGMEGLRSCEKFIMLLPAGKSCHIEAGIAFGLGKKRILIGDPGETESLYLIFKEFYPTIDDFVASLSG